ncbi:uncharacterized protein LOC107047536 isoform X1 [Diachasma alloeum]|uniref:uncharacterized protein LOC107047536 isoform X1 n=1 Tax=Diachasma alloeum TaxID=454923 RepID=UPI00073820FC|nr:uncharacterized protein LOC107047536 isoform X1 [Diachasma alloeum]
MDTVAYRTHWNITRSFGTSNVHVFLELDLRESFKDSAQTCQLYDVPLALKFNREYRLVGIIHYDAKGDHFLAYCRRKSGSWEIHNGLLSKVQPLRGNPKIQPDCAIYIMNEYET